MSSECGDQAILTIQRSRWHGWEDMASATVDGPGYDQHVQYGCSGTGTHTFRTVIEAENLAGHYFFKESNHIRESC